MKHSEVTGAIYPVFAEIARRRQMIRSVLKNLDTTQAFNWQEGGML